MNTENKKIYLDANFLIYWAIPKDDELRKKVRNHLAFFLANKKTLATSPLAIDEMWYGIRNEYKKQNNKEARYADEPLYSILKNFTDQILKKTNILQFADPVAGVNNALNHVKNFNLGPRDSFHLAIMDENSISEIITNDSDFCHIERIKASF